jgi:hypothetical protein
MGVLGRVPPSLGFVIAFSATLILSLGLRSGSDLWALLTLPIVVTLYVGAYLSLRQRNLKLYVEGQAIGKITGLGRRIEVRRAEVAEMRLVTVDVPMAPLQLLLVLDPNQRRLLTVGRAYQFDSQDLTNFAARVGVRLTGSLADVISPDAYSDNYPSTDEHPFHHFHFGTSSFVVIGFLIAVTVFGAAIVLNLR